jgi:hypothetical protein
LKDRAGDLTFDYSIARPRVVGPTQFLLRVESYSQACGVVIAAEAKAYRTSATRYPEKSTVPRFKSGPSLHNSCHSAAAQLLSGYLWNIEAHWGLKIEEPVHFQCTSSPVAFPSKWNYQIILSAN